MPYGITQCYLPPGRGQNPLFNVIRPLCGIIITRTDVCYIEVDSTNCKWRISLVVSVISNEIT